MNHQIRELFKDFEFIENTDILKGNLPNEIFNEIGDWVIECKKIKNNPYGFLREHINVGRNSYQISVPPHLIENSYTFAFINYMSEFYVLGKNKNLRHEDVFRKITLRKYNGHFDGYDFWVNFTYKGDINPLHNHAGNLSSVLYVQNDGLSTIFENGIEYVGKGGEILLFPSNLMHEVKEKTTDNERITISFNMIFN